MIVRQSQRTFVDRLDFVTSVGYGRGPGDRERLGFRGRGPVKVITDLGVLEPDPDSCELTLTQRAPGREPGGREGGHRLAARGGRLTSTDAPPTSEELRCCATCWTHSARAPRHNPSDVMTDTDWQRTDSGLVVRGYRRDHLEVDPPLDWAAYRSTELRAPKNPLIRSRRRSPRSPGRCSARAGSASSTTT